ncbi:hypothetical protein F52700_684 [Fusarium sp. NRRL 52700]|nr:hypothetical protein F52700_684 [Fusarium sp. NRRL 52700]
MPERHVIVVEIAPSLNGHDEQHSLQEKIGLAERRIEGLRDEMEKLDQRTRGLAQKTKQLTMSNGRFEKVLDREQQQGASRIALMDGLKTLKKGEETCLKNEKKMLEMDRKSLDLRIATREWELYRDELKASQEEMKFDAWMRREEGLRYENWKKSKYSRD